MLSSATSCSSFVVSIRFTWKRHPHKIGKNNFTTKHTKDTKGSIIITPNFVLFVNFVVRIPLEYP